MSDRQRAVPVTVETEFRSTDKGHQFIGYAAVFDADSEPLGKSEVIETIAPGAFRDSLAQKARKTFVRDHNDERLLASTTSGRLRLAEDSRGLLVDADLPDTSDARDLRELHDRGEVSGMSFEFKPTRGGVAWSEDGQRRRLLNVRLFHVTALTGLTPAYSTTTAEIRSLAEAVGAEPAAIEDVIDALREQRQLDDDAFSVLERLIAAIRPESAEPRSVAPLLTPKLDEARQLLAR